MSEILLVDDERDLRDSLAEVLKGEGFAVRTAADGDVALSKIDEKRPDLVLLDVMMPRMNGFCCCEEIRRRDPLLPVIFLTAKNSEMDQVRGIGLGGDDYVDKGASDALLLACIRRALARSQKMREELTGGGDPVVRLGDVEADTKFLVVRQKGREIARLTKTEADLLRYMDANRGELLVFDDFITELRGNGYVCEDTMLYSHISHLRRKLGKAGSLILTTRGVGYSLAK